MSAQSRWWSRLGALLVLLAVLLVLGGPTGLQSAAAPAVSPFAARDQPLNVDDPVTADDFYHRGLLRALADDDAPGAIADYDEALRLDPNETRVYGARAIARADVGDLQGAIQDFTEALRYEPTTAEYYQGLGRARARLGDVPGALEALSKAAELYLAQGNSLALLRYQQTLEEIDRLQHP